MPKPRVIVVTGPVGSGKSTTVDYLSRHLVPQGIRHWSVDQDFLRSVYPTPADDPFGARLGLENLAACWANVRRRDVAYVLIADVVEHPDDVRGYADALGVARADITVVRLSVSADELVRRLHDRESPETLAWHLERAPQLQAIMEANGVGDLVLEADGQTPAALAATILAEPDGVSSAGS